MYSFFKKAVKKLIIRPLIRVKNALFPPAPFVWFKLYPGWEAASADATGYDAINILETCKKSLIMVRDGLAAYERDSVVFDKLQPNEGLLKGLKQAAGSSKKLCVLDFGGSLGSIYYQCRNSLGHLEDLKWCIVEQPHFVDCGKENFENKELKFFSSVEECLESNRPDVLLLSSVLQYLDSPATWIKKFIALKIPFIIIDRTAFIRDSTTKAGIQFVPDYVYKASYPCWFFNGEEFNQQFGPEYRLQNFFDSGYTPPMNVDGYDVYWNGMILKHAIS